MNQKPMVYRLEGSVDPDNATTIKTQVEAFIDQAPQAIEISLDGLQSHNSLVIGLMMSWMRYAHRQEKRLTFSHVPDRLLNIIEFSGLNGTLPLENPEHTAGERVVE